jgi:RND family efflux transporter MFP subunit
MKTYIKYGIFSLLGTLIAIFFYNKIYVTKSTFETTKPEQGDLLVATRAIGNVSAKDIYEITPQSSGVIEDIYFDEGEWVKKGDLLFSIKPIELPLLQEEAETMVNKARMQKNSLGKTKEGLIAQQKLLQTTYERYTKLLAQKFVTQAEYDKSKSELETLNAQIATLDSEILTAELEILGAQKNLQALNAKRFSLKVYAPVDGYITKKSAQKEQYILASQSVFRIVDATTLWIEVNVDERVAKQIVLEAFSTIKLRSCDTLFNGKVKRIFAQSNPVTRERKVAVAFDSIPMPFYLNEQAEVNIASAKYENVLKLPLSLVEQKDARLGVWVVKENHAYFTPITLLAKNHQEVAILEGITKNDTLLIPAQEKRPLMHGMRVYQ